MSKQQATLNKKEISLLQSIDVEQLLKSNARSFQSVMPKHFDMRTLFRLAVTELRKNPDLMKCTTESLIGALIECAQLGLELGTGKAYLVPRWNKHIGAHECDFQTGYKGLIELALRSGKILKISAHCVFENDYFEYEYGTNQFLIHKPSKTERGEFVEAYAIAQFANNFGNVFEFEVMSKAEIEEIRLRSSSAGSSYSPWKTDYYEMARKTPTRKLCKYLPSNTELALALSLDDKDTVGVTIEQSSSQSKTDKIKQSLENKKAQTLVDIKIKEAVTGNAEAYVDLPVDKKDDWVEEYDKA